jgi:maltose alpha-D-glucosyltransferase/alpha-amylase
VKKLASANDPLWYKDAVIYELHVRAFADSNNDGIGDFPGLISKLDYLQDLGVTCIWLLPFFPSPLRDDGYDISNYIDVNPSYGTLSDFKTFLGAAHQRNMQVMIELVVNHTSDQHPWFKAARAAPPGSAQREMYVWSDTDQLYKDARIIFTDTEKSNWTWDEVAKAYYWHRFFSHQPDLNYENPVVLEEVLKAMRFWLDMGVDALRMDAIPYICERENTSCENLPETHVVIKKIRAAIDADYANRLILAEANQWPADVRPYFGDGDECQMAFHFPLMPRIYMALRQEDRLPITDIMAQTPPIPDACQWALFLRNHDELTLEMVTADERDYMYFAYSADPRMRVNVGIRRRLAPLVDNNRRRIELLNSLLLSFPGTPILYYGDEIGMGDNIYLGDRNGVRTPMQWTSDRNAGFSKCDPARLYFPVIMDPIYGYQVVNVEAQLSDQSSLLHWTHNMIALRKLFQVFGRGTLTFLNPGNRKILAYLRGLKRDDGTQETVLCVANLSRFAQPVALDLSDYAGVKPIEMLGYVPFPSITQGPYALSLAPYSFLWLELPSLEVEPEFELHHAADDSAEIKPLEVLTTDWADFLASGGVTLLEAALPAWLPGQRWFGAKSRTIQSVRVRNWVPFPAASAHSFASVSSGKGSFPFADFFIEVEYADGEFDLYQLPLAISTSNKKDQRPGDGNTIAAFTSDAGPAVLLDAAEIEDFHADLLKLIESNATLPLAGRDIHLGRRPEPVQPFAPLPSVDDEPITLLNTGSAAPAVPAPIDAQPGEAATPPRSSAAAALSAGAQSIQPRESPTAGDPAPGPGRLDARKSSAFPGLNNHRLPSRAGYFEQSNTSIIYGDRFILKLFRHIEAGENPEVEIGRFLTDVAHFHGIPSFLGEISISPELGVSATAAMLQGFFPNQGDGWQWFLAQLEKFFSQIALRSVPADIHAASFFSSGSTPISDVPQAARITLEAAAQLGRRTAQMHLALSAPSELTAFTPEPVTRSDLEQEAEQIAAQIRSNLEVLKRSLPLIDDSITESAGLLLSRRFSLLSRARAIANLPEAGQRIRVHGDFHLGQTLRAKAEPDQNGEPGDFVIIDFEGEPARTLAERRQKQSPLKDVAGIMRSFSYAAYSALDRIRSSAVQNERAFDSEKMEGWARWWQNAASAEFVHSYRRAIAIRPELLPPPAAAQSLLEVYMLEKAMYEMLYELNNRPHWLHIPVAGILCL